MTLLKLVFKKLSRSWRGKRRNADTVEAELARLEEIALSMRSDGSWLQQETELPSESDFALIGKFIQVYCVADFNARRVINGLRAICLGEEEDFSSRLNDKDVLTHLKISAAAWTGSSNVSDGVVRAAEILEMHRELRHNFAHWIVRRLRNADALLILTKNAGEARKRSGTHHARDEATWGLFIPASVKVEMGKMQLHSDFLSKLAVHLEEDCQRLREEHLTRAAPAPQEPGRTGSTRREG